MWWEVCASERCASPGPVGDGVSHSAPFPTRLSLCSVLLIVVRIFWQLRNTLVQVQTPLLSSYVAVNKITNLVNFRIDHMGIILGLNSLKGSNSLIGSSWLVRDVVRKKIRDW